MVMVMVEADAGAAMAAAAGRADRLDHPIASSIVGVHDDESWHGSTSDPTSSSKRQSAWRPCTYAIAGRASHNRSRRCGPGSCPHQAFGS